MRVNPAAMENAWDTQLSITMNGMIFNATIMSARTGVFHTFVKVGNVFLPHRKENQDLVNILGNRFPVA